MLLFRKETGSESRIGSSPATSYTSLYFEIVSYLQTEVQEMILTTLAQIK